MTAEAQVQAPPVAAAALLESTETVRDRQWQAADAAAAGVFVAITLFVVIFGPGRFEDKLLGALKALAAGVAIDLLQQLGHRVVRKRTGGKPSPAALRMNARLHARWPRIFRRLPPDYDQFAELHRQRHKLAFFAFAILLLQWVIEAADVDPQARAVYFTVIQAGIAAGAITWAWVGAIGERPGSTARRGALAGAGTAALIGLIALLIFRIGHVRLLFHTMLLWTACGYLGGRMIERGGLTFAALRAMGGVVAAMVGLGVLYWLFNWTFAWVLHLMLAAGWGLALLLYRPAAALETRSAT